MDMQVVSPLVDQSLRRDDKAVGFNDAISPFNRKNKIYEKMGESMNLVNLSWLPGTHQGFAKGSHYLRSVWDLAVGLAENYAEQEIPSSTTWAKPS